MEKICPCKDCDERTAICHKVCMGYKVWHEEHVKERRKENQRRYAFNAGYTKRFEDESWRKKGER